METDSIGGSGGGGGDALGRVCAGEEYRADRGRRRARSELQAAGNAALSRSRCGDRQGAGCGRGGGARIGDAESREPLQCRARQVRIHSSTGADRRASDARGEADRHAHGVSGDAQTGVIFARAGGCGEGADRQRRTIDAAAEPARIFELRRVPGLRGEDGMPVLLGHADLSSARPAHAMPLLQLFGSRAGPVPQVR